MTRILTHTKMIMDVPMNKSGRTNFKSSDHSQSAGGYMPA